MEDIIYYIPNKTHTNYNNLQKQKHIISIITIHFLSMHAVLAQHINTKQRCFLYC